MKKLYKFAQIAFFFVFFVSCYQDQSDPIQTDVNIEDFEKQLLENDPQWQWLRQEFEKNKLLFDSLKFYESSGDQMKLASVKIALANRFRESGNYDGGLEFLNEVHKDETILLPDSIKGKIFHGLASIYFELYYHNNTETFYLDSAAFFSDQFYVISLNNKTNNQTLLDALNLKGAILLHQGENNEALKYLEEGLMLYQKDNNLFVLALLLNYGHTLHGLGNYDQAMKISELAHELALQKNHIVFEGSALDLRALIFESTGDTDSANKMHEEHRHLIQRKDVLMNELLARQQVLNYYRNQDQNTIMGLYNEQYFLFRLSWMLVIGMVILLIIAATAVYLYRQNKQLMVVQLDVIKSKQQNDELKLKNTELELETRQAREKALVVEVGAQKSALVAKIVTLSKLNEFLCKIVSDIKTSKNKGLEQDKIRLLTRLEKDISSHIDNGLWNEFDLLINEANNEFLKKLMVDHPDLTITEKRLAFMIVMNFSTKEISEIMAKNYRSVEMARYRLRIKLGLDKNESLTAYLNQYSSKPYQA